MVRLVVVLVHARDEPEDRHDVEGEFPAAREGEGCDGELGKWAASKCGAIVDYKILFNDCMVG